METPQTPPNPNTTLTHEDELAQLMLNWRILQAQANEVSEQIVRHILNTPEPSSVTVGRAIAQYFKPADVRETWEAAANRELDVDDHMKETWSKTFDPVIDWEEMCKAHEVEREVIDTKPARVIVKTKTK